MLKHTRLALHASAAGSINSASGHSVKNVYLEELHQNSFCIFSISDVMAGLWACRTPSNTYSGTQPQIILPSVNGP
jgi:hypothetical protein